MQTKLNNVRREGGGSEPWPVSGSYAGEWSGYIVRFDVAGVTWTADSDMGVRGRTGCVVEIARDTATVRVNQ